MKNETVTTIQQLKELSDIDGGTEFTILCYGGLKSTKHIIWDEDKFHIDHYIDGSRESLTEEEFQQEENNIWRAMQKGNFIHTGE